MKKPFFLNTGFLFIPALFFFLMFSVIVPKLSITFYSSENGIAQLNSPVTGKANVYSEKTSTSRDVKKGINTLHHPLPLLIGKENTLRWNPGNKKDVKIVLQSITIDIAGKSLPIAVSAKPGKGLVLGKSEEESLHPGVSWITTSKDPQIHIIYNNNLLIVVRILAPLIIIGIALPLFSPFARVVKRADGPYQIWSKSFDKEHFFREYTIPLFWFLGTAILFHLYEITHFMLSIDDEFTALRTSSVVWIAQGRWLTFLIEQYFLNLSVMPYGTFLISLFFMSCSYLLFIHFLEAEINWKVYLTFPIFSSFPTLWFINEFYGNMAPVSIGFFLVALSFWWANKWISTLIRKNNSPLVFCYTIFPSALFFAASIGCYQSFAMLFPVFFCAKLIFNTFYPYQLSGKNNQTTLQGKSVVFNQPNIIYIIVSILGLVFYFVINKFFLWKYDVVPKYIHAFLKPDVFFSAPFTAIKTTVKTMVGFYSGATDIYGVSLFSAGVIVVLALAFIFSQPARNKANRLDWLVVQACFLLLLFSPFVLNIIADGLPYRSYVAIPSVIWFCAFFLLNRPHLQEKVLYAFILFLLHIQIVSTNGQYAAVSNVVQKHDRLLAKNLYNRLIAANPSFDHKKPIVLDVYGWKYFNTTYPSPNSSTMAASFFNWSGGNITRITRYMNLIGYNNIQGLDTASRGKLTEKFEKMPVWPAEGSVIFANEVYMVKLGSIPDLRHLPHK